MAGPTFNQGYWSSRIGYKELYGSGEQEVSQDANSAKRNFLVPWAQGMAFAADLVGVTRIIAGGAQKRTPPKRDPDRDALVCKKATVKGVRLAEPSRGVIAYRYAQIEADFSLPDKPDANDGEDNEGTTILSESYEPMNEVIPIEGWDLLWQAGSQEGEPVGEEATYNFILRKVKLTISVERWYNPPLIAMLLAAGQINESPFRPTVWTYPAETLMFNFPGASYELTTRTKSIAEIPWSLSLEFCFHPYGWNTLFNSKDLVFLPVATEGGLTPARTYDFTKLLPASYVQGYAL